MTNTMPQRTTNEATSEILSATPSVGPYYPWHQSALAQIAEQIRENRQPHATLLRLRSGHDDAILAKQLCQYLLCDDIAAPESCKHARLVNENAHPNLIALDIIHQAINFSPLEKRKIGIDDVRNLEQQMWQTSMFDKPKIAYLQGIDLLSIAAQNALLKTLEEPPKNTFFVLTVQNLSRVLPTIISRTQRLHLGKPASETIVNWLQHQLDPPMNSADISKIAKMVDFAPLPSLELLQSPDARQKLTQEKNQFAQFISGKISARALEKSLEKDNKAEQLLRYSRYTEQLIQVLFNQTVAKDDTAAEKTSKSSANPVHYQTWHGITITALYRLHDTLSALRKLADSPVNFPLQFTANLTEWQNEQR